MESARLATMVINIRRALLHSFPNTTHNQRSKVHDVLMLHNLSLLSNNAEKKLDMLQM